MEPHHYTPSFVLNDRLHRGERRFAHRTLVDEAGRHAAAEHIDQQPAALRRRPAVLRRLLDRSTPAIGY